MKHTRSVRALSQEKTKNGEPECSTSGGVSDADRRGAWTVRTHCQRRWRGGRKGSLLRPELSRAQAGSTHGPAPRASRKRATAPPRSKHRPETAPPLAQAGSVYDPFPNRAESGNPHCTALRRPAHRPEATRGPAPHRSRKRTRPPPAPRRGGSAHGPAPTRLKLGPETVAAASLPLYRPEAPSSSDWGGGFPSLFSKPRGGACPHCCRLCDPRDATAAGGQSRVAGSALEGGGPKGARCTRRKPQ